MHIIFKCFLGFTIGFRIIFPGECGGDALCDFLKAHIGPVTSSGITLIGNLTQTGISCEWKANYITIATNLHLSNVIFKVFGGNVIQSGLFATFNLKLYNFTFEGIKTYLLHDIFTIFAAF